MHSRLISWLIFLTFVAGAEPARGVKPRVLSGEYEYGEKYTDVFVAPEMTDEARDDEEYDLYRFKKGWLQYDHDLSDEVKLSARTQTLVRDYVNRPLLDNTTNYAKLRFSYEPTESWAFWPTVSYRVRDYENSALDNRIVTAGVEARYRWGVRDNVRIGLDVDDSQYDNDATRDRISYGILARLEKPVTEDLTLKVGGRYRRTDFETQSASRRNADQGSGSVGFRYEF